MKIDSCYNIKEIVILFIISELFILMVYFKKIFKGGNKIVSKILINVVVVIVVELFIKLNWFFFFFYVIEL